MGHSFFAPSSAPRVVKCPASLLLTADMPDTGSVDAAHGTAAHWVADLCLRGKHHVDRYAGCVVAVGSDGQCCFVHGEMEAEMADNSGMMVFEVDDEMVEAVQEYVDWCNDLPGDHHPECRVDISQWCPTIPEDMIFLPPAAYEPQGGTSDHAACAPGTLVITDLKYGKGVRVFAQENFQAVLYALGFIAEWDWLYDFKKIVIRICQPRLDHKDEWEITREEIEAIGRYILERFTLALQPDAPFGPSDYACKFCKASGQCRAQRDYLYEQRSKAFDPFDDEAEPDPRLLTTDELVQTWRDNKLFKDFETAVSRELMRRREAGEELPGLRVVESRTNRRWADEKKAIETLTQIGLSKGQLVEPREMLSPAKVEKLLPKAKRGVIEELVTRPVGNPSLVEASDARPDYVDARQARVDEVFDDLT